MSVIELGCPGTINHRYSTELYKSVICAVLATFPNGTLVVPLSSKTNIILN